MAGMLGTVAEGDNTGELVITRDAPAELEQLYATHARSLTQALHAAGYPDAADAVQDAFVQAVVHWRKVSRYDDPLAWIRRVAINRGHNRRRSRKRQQAVQQRMAAAATVPVPVVEADDDLAAMVAALPQQQRLALSLFYFADLSVAEVAHSMELSEGAVKYHLHAARTSLARCLEARDDI
jgi:RNA polymerase sigma-70 factor (ECF subfamily)